MAAPMMAPNGTRFGGWLLNTADNQFGLGGRLRRDGRRRDPGHEPVGHRHPPAGRALDRADDAAERHALRRLAAQHRRQRVLRVQAEL